jgi:hypothetical protein
MTIKKEKNRKMDMDEDMLNRKRRKQYKKTKKRNSWEDQEESYDDIYEGDSCLDYLYDDEDDIRQITDIHDWVKNN